MILSSFDLNKDSWTGDDRFQCMRMEIQSTIKQSFSLQLTVSMI
jgi:hypothetical protein